MKTLQKSRYVSSLKKEAEAGREFEDLFLVVAKKLATSSRDKPYLRLTLGDRTGTVEGFLWDNAVEVGAQIEEGDLVEVRGRPQVHKDAPQLRIERLRPVADRDKAGLDPAEFRPGLDGAVRRRLWEEILALLGQVGDPYLRALLDQYTGDDAFREAFLEAPAAKSFHHAYVGGLAEHTVAVMRLAAAVAAQYPDRLQPDLLLTGAFLHDLAKTLEMDPRTGNYTDAGRLLGHIALGGHELRRRAAQVPGFPPPVLLHLEHLILSHHERIDWGSPVEPQTLEALVLNFVDNLDAKLAGAWAWLEGEEVLGGHWSTYWKGLGRSLLRTHGPGSAAAPAAHPGFGDLEAELLRRDQAGPPSPAAPPPLRGPKRSGQGSLGF